MMPESEHARNLPPAEWDAWWSDRAPDNVRCAIADEIQDAAVGAARVAAYFHARAMNHNHATAVAESNRVVRAVAKALRYSYPKAHELTF